MIFKKKNIDIGLVRRPRMVHGKETAIRGSRKGDEPRCALVKQADGVLKYFEL